MPERLKNRLLARFPFLGGLSEAQLDALAGQGALLRLPAATVVFREHEPCQGFPLLLEGSIRVVKAAPNGREIVLYRIDPGEGCILSSGCLLAGADHSAVAIVDRDAEILLVPPALFQELLVESDAFRRFVFRMYGERMAEVVTLVEEVAFRRLDARLAQLLVRQGPVITATHQRIADELGSVREIVSRLLRGFAERGWVRLERERISIADPRALAELAKHDSGT